MELSLTLLPPLANRSERSLLHHGVNPSPRLVAPPRYPTRPRMDMLSNVARASLVDDNGSPTTPSVSVSDRFGEVKRVTKETNVSVRLNLDGLVLLTSQLASHGLIDVHVRATGDVHIDDHPPVKMLRLPLARAAVLLTPCLLYALLQAIGDRNGINRFGDFSAPLDEALIHVALKTLKDIHFEHLSGRPYLGYDLQIPTQRVGTYDTQRSGRNSHLIIEATFKAFAKALRQVTEADLRRHGTIPSSKGVLSRS